MTERDKIVEIVARGIYSEEPVGVREWQDAPVATADSCRAMATAALAALEQAGYAVVPREPTEDMVNKGGSELTPEWLSDESPFFAARNVWLTMLAASSPKE
jgi:hypothetical protein